LALARAIATNPEVILADEPTGNLDSENSRIVIDHLCALNDQGATVVIITHDHEIAKRASRQIHVIDGRASESTRRTGDGDRSVTPGKARPEGPIHDRPMPRGSVSHGRWHGLADDLGDAIDSLSQRLLRSSLLVLAFVLGISGLIAAVGLSESASAQVSERLTQAALDEVRIDAPGGSALLSAKNKSLAVWVSKLEALPHVIDVGFVASVSSSAAHIRRLSDAEPAPGSDYFLVAASPDYLEMMGVTSAGGAPLGMLGDNHITSAAWVGEDVVSGLDLPAPGEGATLWAAGRRVDVVGAIRAGSRAPHFNKMIFVTPDVISGLSDVGVRLVVRTEPGFPTVVADAAPVALNPSSPGEFRVETTADLRTLRFGVANDLGTFVGILSIILLALATISASTTMYLSVQSRAQEIALRRAIGSSRSAIARLFVAEGLLIGATGGAIGSLVGAGAVLLGAYAQGWTPILPLGLAPLAIVLGVGTGLLSAVVPAWSASRQEPAAAIRN